MEERDWIVLQTLYREKNITNAAKKLFISQPALTNRLQQMEKEFSVKIVNRGRRGVQFTPQGEYLAKCADEMLFRLQQIKENVRNMEDNVSGTLRLAVSTFFTDYKLPALLRGFKDQYPNVEFKVTTGWSSEMMDLIYKEEAHVAFVKGDYSWNEGKKLLLEEPVYVASKEKIDLEHLPELPRIDYHADPMLQTVIDEWWRAHFSKPPFISIEVDKASTSKNMAENGLGYAILPDMVLHDSHGLYKQPLYTKDGELITRKTWMFFHEESRQLHMVQAFVEFVEGLDLKEID
ncbi:LysR family transcriptional regulator [Bacillus thermotolerans]|uniref:LysR family transcriptional regulator n=1 Tax=Bacillus thermotolerans TaxID=1221996 RepID=UPI0005890080|nr:LysR family transcriptional regulator [Bacillus thermotolerans]KKB37306.1 transcriptional regulator [Bacillus thermotolerans]